MYALITDNCIKATDYLHTIKVFWWIKLKYVQGGTCFAHFPKFDHWQRWPHFSFTFGVLSHHFGLHFNLTT